MVYFVTLSIVILFIGNVTLGLMTKYANGELFKHIRMMYIKAKIKSEIDSATTTLLIN